MHTACERVTARVRLYVIGCVVWVHHAGASQLNCCSDRSLSASDKIKYCYVLIAHQHLSPHRTLCVLPTLHTLTACVEAYEGRHVCDLRCAVAYLSIDVAVDGYQEKPILIVAAGESEDDDGGGRGGG